MVRAGLRQQEVSGEEPWLNTVSKEVLQFSPGRSICRAESIDPSVEIRPVEFVAEWDDDLDRDVPDATGGLES